MLIKIKNMKKHFLSISLGALTFLGFGQISPVTFGPQIGFNQTSLSTDLSDYQESAQAGLQGGLFVRLTLKKIIIQPEAVIGIKRGQIDFTYTPTGSISNPLSNVNATQDLSLTTLDVPVMVGYQLLDIPLIKIRANAGPVASVVLNQKVTVSKNEGLAEVPTADLVQLQEDALWSVQAGIGVDVWKLAVDARYNFGISYIDASSKIKNNLFTINVGFKIL
jgi:hypothetical protein